MKKIWTVLRWPLLALLLVAGYAGYRLAWGHPFTINQLADRQGLLMALDDPELLTDLGLIDGTLLDRHSGKLTPVGVARRDAGYARAERYLRELHEFDRAALAQQDQITYDILEEQWNSTLAFRQFPWWSSEGLYPVNQMAGTNVSLMSFMLTSHVISNARSAEHYVRRLEALGAKLDAVTTEMQRQAGAGVVLPISLVERDIGIGNDSLAPPPEKNPLVQKLVTAVAGLKDLDPAARTALEARAVAAMNTGVYPAFRRMNAALEAQRPAAATQAAGIGRLTDGAAVYALLLRQRTTTDYTPEQVHQIGLAEVARISAEMEAIFKAQGMDKGTLAERLQSLNTRPDQLFPNTADGRAQILARYNQIMREVEARMPEYFNTMPAGSLTIMPVPDALQKGAASGSYRQPAMDGSRPGIFFANLRDAAETPRFTMKTLAYHEGVPGHHFQISTAMQLPNLPVIRKMSIYTAYVEGWALYAEGLAADIGMYKDDPTGDLGRLQNEIWRAVRLVVDTGMHAKGWTREQAIAYMVANTGLAESTVTTEIERYMAIPGQACAYKLGQLKILELREKAKLELGAKFSIKDFHSVVLDSGAVPLTVLEQLVDDWIAKVKAA